MKGTLSPPRLPSHQCAARALRCAPTAGNAPRTEATSATGRGRHSSESALAEEKAAPVFCGCAGEGVWPPGHGRTAHLGSNPDSPASTDGPWQTPLTSLSLLEPRAPELLSCHSWIPAKRRPTRRERGRRKKPVFMHGNVNFLGTAPATRTLSSEAELTAWTPWRLQR